MSCRVARLLCALFLVCTTSAFAQDDAQDPRAPEVSSEPPAHISVVDGTAVLERDGQPDVAPENMPLLAGDRVRTDEGRVEILFADGSTLHLDARTTVDFQSDELVRLLDGRIRLAIPGPDRGVRYRIDAPSASVEIESPGEYRVSILRRQQDPEVELAVLRGSAELVNEAGRTPLRAGERAYSRANAAPSYAYAFNSASWDAFDRWSEARRDQRLGVSTQYLPEEVRPYAGSFDRNGSWRYESSYGYVWYPTVSVGWRPYHNGRWVTLRPYGWTWVGADPWAWPTHHYGRWGISAGVWFWIPGRSWAPAWVSWAYAPGYVSWCPLGWNNRPVLQIVGRYGRGYDPWRAWTAVPDRRFGGRYNVRSVTVRDIDSRTRRAFVTRDRAPDFRGYAVPRSSAPIRIAGTAPARRGGSPVYTNLEPRASRVGPGPSRTMVGPSRSTVAAPNRGVQAGIATDRPRAIPRADAGDNAATRPGGVRTRSTQGLQSPGQGVPTAPTERFGAPDRAAGAGLVRRATPRYDPYRGQTPATVRGSDPNEASRSYGGQPPATVGGADRSAPYRPYGGQTPATVRGATPNAPSRPFGGQPPATVRGSAPRGSGNYIRQAPDRGPENGPRAVPRAEPRAAAPQSGPGPGADRRGPAPARPAGAPAGGHSRSGGRGR